MMGAHTKPKGMTGREHRLRLRIDVLADDLRKEKARTRRLERTLTSYRRISGRCAYCGGRTTGRYSCAAHADIAAMEREMVK